MLEAVAVATRLAQYVVLLGLFGAAAYHVYAARTSPVPSGRGFRNGAAAGLVVVSLALLVQAAQMTGSMFGAMDPEAHWAILTGTSLGVACWARAFALLGVLLLFARTPARPHAFGRATVLSGLAVASLAWNGHGAGGEGATGLVRLLSTMAHLLAAGLWFGALILFLRDLVQWRRRDVAATQAGLAGFAGVGSFCVAVLVATGLLNAVLLAGYDPRTLLETLWGRLLLLKLALFGLMLALAAHNRFTLTPSLSRSLSGGQDHGSVVAKLRRSLVVETSAALAVVTLVAWLGTLSPTPSA